MKRMIVLVVVALALGACAKVPSLIRRCTSPVSSNSYAM